jgi:hypothetical protein
MNTQTTTTTTDEARQGKVQAIVDTALDIGRTWAKHGLSIGRQALESNAKTLHLAAESLGKLAAAIEAKRGEASEADAQAPVETKPTDVQ